MFSTKVRVFLLLLAAGLWVANGIYAIYVNSLRLEQYKLIQELRKVRKENDRLYWEISKELNYRKALEYAQSKGMVEVKPYRVANFYPLLKDKPLIDFYYVWLGDTPSKIAKKLGVPLKVLIKFNPSLRWGYVVPMQRIIYPVSFPVVESSANSTKSAQGKKKTEKGANKKPSNK